MPSALGVQIKKLFANSGSLKGRAYRATVISVSAHLVSLFLRLLGTVIVSRLLSPSIFGVLAVITAVQIVITLLTDVGLKPALVQSPNGEKEEFQNTAWTLQVLRGVGIFFLTVFIALLLKLGQAFEFVPPRSTFAEPSLPLLVAVNGFAAVILGLQSINSTLSSRALHLGRATSIELTSQCISLGVAILLAWITGSIWSYIVSGLVGALLNSILSYLWLKGRQARFAWHAPSVDELKRYGKWVFVSYAVGALGFNGDRLLLAAFFSPTALGHFSIASNIASIPDGIIARLHGAVSFPALSEVWRNQPERLSEVYWKIRQLLDPLALVLSGALFAAGPEIIHLLYDVRYATAGRMLGLLSLSLLFSRFGIASNVYLAVGRPKYVTVITALKLVSLAVSVPILYALFDVEGAIIAIALHMMPVVVVIFVFNQKLGLNKFVKEVIILLAWPIGWLTGLLFSHLVSLLK